MTYTFKCTAHKKPMFAYIQQSMMDKLDAPKCVTCNNQMVRVYDAPPVTWMGSGWAGKS
jgi:predicted nucleic acid-binding Zn ribbon protein